MHSLHLISSGRTVTSKRAVVTKKFDLNVVNFHTIFEIQLLAAEDIRTFEVIFVETILQ